MDNFVTNVLILGKSGSGKSTLVNYLYGKEIAVARVGRPVTPEGLHHHAPFLYKNMNIVIWDSWGLEPDKAQKWLDNVKNELIRKSGQPDIKDWIHTVIYCYDAKMSRLDSYEVEHVLKPLIDMGYRVIFALTKWGRCSPAEKEAAKEVFSKKYPGFSAIPVESISQKLRNGKTTSIGGREDIFREICLNLRKNLMYHLKIRARNEMLEALNRAKYNALAYYDDHTGYIFTIYGEDLMNEIQNIARKSYENSIKEVYKRLWKNISRIDNMCVAVIKGYTGIDISEKLKELHVIMNDIKNTQITAWTGDGSEYVSSILYSVLTAGVSFFLRKSSYREDLEKKLGEISLKLWLDLESFTDTLDNEEINEGIAAKLKATAFRN